MKKILSLLFTQKALMLLAIGLLCCGTQAVVAQTSAKKITGKVVDTANEPLAGVTVSIVGTTMGVLTDMDGEYNISVNSPTAILKFSYIGFTSQEISAKDKNQINVTLAEDYLQLEDVVVVGYGVQKKSHLTGSITKVRTDGLDDIPASRLDQALQGRIAGVQIQNLTSEVGEAPQIRVRGMGSISAGAEPLIIVDGFPIEGGLGVVNTNDVESIEVLKDAASAAIYGSRAANGVILITTKQGTVNKPKYTLKTSWGIKDAYKTHPIMSSSEYMDMRINEFRLKGDGKVYDNEFPFLVITNDTDWQEEGLRTANIYNVQFGISGGSKDVTYYVSGSYNGDQGIMIKNEYEKMNIRAKIDAKLSKRVSVGVNIAPTYAHREKPTINFIDFYRIPSWMPVRHTAQTAAITKLNEGDYAHGAQFNDKDYTGYDPIMEEMRTVATRPFNSANHNPRMILDNEDSFQKDYRLQTSAYLNLNLMEGFDFKTSNGFNILYSDINSYRNKKSRSDNAENRGLYQNNLVIDMLSENTLTYATKFDKVHDVTFLLGASAQKITRKQAGILGAKFPTDYIHTLNAAGNIMQYENTTQYTGTWRQEETMTSFFSRATYAYEDRYLLSASLRTDGSSKFGHDNLWGWFPSASIGWRVTEEPFIKGNPNWKWLSQLKTRASYGITGTNSIPNYANTNKMQSAGYIWGTGTGDVGPGLANNSAGLANSKLRWEQTNEYNVGIDLSVLNSRIGLVLDYYYSTTKSLLFEKNINSVSGYLRGWSNEGKVRNKGLEIELTTYNIENKTFSWNTSINFGTNSNKLLDLGGDYQIFNQGERKEIYLARVGGPAIQFYGFKTIGIWNNQNEVDTNPKYITDKEGGLRVQNTNGDDVIDDRDMVVLGDPFPDFTWGMINNFKYRNFDLSVLLQGVQGMDVFNGDAFYNETRKWNRNYVTNRWVNAEHTGDGKTPFQNNGIDHLSTDYPIQDGSYIALRDITLGFAVPRKILKKTMLSKVRIYTSIQNLGYWFTGDYKGINPEARMTSNQYNNPLVSGYQRGAFPLQRTFSFGIDINF